MPPPAWRDLPVVAIVIAIVDFLFATVLVEFFYKTGSRRLWQGVASTLLGRSAMEGGARTVAIGILMHIGVALAWSIVFFFLARNSQWIREANPLLVAAIYGPMVWIVMSWIVIPMLTGRPPNITLRWWIQLAGHIFFVGLPIVGTTWLISNRTRRTSSPSTT